jgi:hypothetical protein
MATFGFKAPGFYTRQLDRNAAVRAGNQLPHDNMETSRVGSRPPTRSGLLPPHLEEVGGSVRVRICGTVLRKLRSKAVAPASYVAECGPDAGGRIPVVGDFIVTSTGQNVPVTRDYLCPASGGKGCKPGPQTIRTKRFSLGRQLLRGHVVRECLGVLPDDTRTGGEVARPLEVPARETPGPLSFVDKFWKPLHMRVGFFPRRETPVLDGACEDQPVPRVNWVLPRGSAEAALSKQLGKEGPVVRKAAEASAGARVRARARWVLSLNPDKQARYVGALLKGRWTPDLSREFAHPRLSAFVAARGRELKFFGGGTLNVKSAGSEKFRDVAFVWALHEGTVFRLVPELLARLATYATFRKRNGTLVQSLRTRCQEWCKAEGVPTEVTAELLAPTVALAFSPSEQEKVGTAILEGCQPASSGSESWWNASA